MLSLLIRDKRRFLSMLYDYQHNSGITATLLRISYTRIQIFHGLINIHNINGALNESTMKESFYKVGSRFDPKVRFDPKLAKG